MQNEEDIFPFENDEDSVEKDSELFDDDFMTDLDEDEEENREDDKGLDFNH